jgi:hypothetical protein
MRFQVLTVASMKIAVFWDVVPYMANVSEVLIASIIRAVSKLRMKKCVKVQDQVRKDRNLTVSTSEMLVNFCQTTRCNMPEDSHLQVSFKLHNISSS